MSFGIFFGIAESFKLEQSKVVFDVSRHGKYASGGDVAKNKWNFVVDLKSLG